MQYKKYLWVLIILACGFSNISHSEYDPKNVMLKMDAEDSFFQIEEWVHSDQLNGWIAKTKLMESGTSFMSRGNQLVYSQLLTGTKNGGHNAMMRCAKIATFVFTQQESRNEVLTTLQNFMSDKRDRIKNIEGTAFSLKFKVNKDQGDVTFFCSVG